ncbi:copper amine oxidase N-terminal domain-containing protein [Effusibacillus dendaii]|uniref:Copper amine oxidase-like N-terminal domain-containing protein n=1 Tax=Effusibacillus dendaii TaxID=2743772 RepID=A0A7I8DD79_9BACL|nr:copper amine oxidase N-terminal domain-containing protein [Effusibacillus dendaii]BCJ88173.1 hypothetical protein skT53_31580 [Effusibacillus dendaii]
MKKKTMARVVGLAIVAGIGFGNIANAEVVSENFGISINGQAYVTPEGEQKPYINQDGRTMVPVRFVSQQLGAYVNWDQYSQKVTITGNKTIQIQVGQSFINVDGQRVQMDTQAELTKDRVFIPARFIGEALGAQVNWDGQTVSFQVPQTPANSSNMKQNEDGSYSFDNVYQATVRTNQSEREKENTVNLLSQIKWTTSGNTVTVSVPATGSENLHWIMQDSTPPQWDGTTAHTRTTVGGWGQTIILYDITTGAQLAKLWILYKNGEWVVKYPSL